MIKLTKHQLMALLCLARCARPSEEGFNLPVFVFAISAQMGGMSLAKSRQVADVVRDIPFSYLKELYTNVKYEGDYVMYLLDWEEKSITRVVEESKVYEADA